MEQLYLWDMFDQAVAEGLGVEVETYINAIDLFDDIDMEYIIVTILSPDSSEKERQKAKELFNTKIVK